MVVLNIFYFHPYLGKIPILTNMFQRGWNNQLDSIFIYIYSYTEICCFQPDLVASFFHLWIERSLQDNDLQIGIVEVKIGWLVACEFIDSFILPTIYYSN